MPRELAKVIYGPGLPEILDWLKVFLKFLETENIAQIRGSSLLIVMDDTTQTYRVRLIDLSSFEDIGERDEGMVTGVKNLIKYVEQSQ